MFLCAPVSAQTQTIFDIDAFNALAARAEKGCIRWPNIK